MTVTSFRRILALHEIKAWYMENENKKKLYDAERLSWEKQVVFD